LNLEESAIRPSKLEFSKLAPSKFVPLKLTPKKYFPEKSRLEASKFLKLAPANKLLFIKPIFWMISFVRTISLPLGKSGSQRSLYSSHSSCRRNALLIVLGLISLILDTNIVILAI